MRNNEMGVRGAKLFEQRRRNENDEQSEKERVFHPSKLLILLVTKV